MMWLGGLLVVLAGLIMAALFIIRIIQAISLLAVFILVAAVIGFGWFIVIVIGISFASLYQMWGEANAGWAAVTAGLIGLFTSIGLVRMLFQEIFITPARLKQWLGKN